MVLPLPLWGMKLWFARVFRAGHGDLTAPYRQPQESLSQLHIPSPNPAGWKFVNLGSFAGAGPRDLSKALMSRGNPSSDPP